MSFIKTKNSQYLNEPALVYNHNKSGYLHIKLAPIFTDAVLEFVKYLRPKDVIKLLITCKFVYHKIKNSWQFQKLARQYAMSYNIYESIDGPDYHIRARTEYMHGVIHFTKKYPNDGFDVVNSITTTIYISGDFGDMYIEYAPMRPYVLKISDSHGKITEISKGPVACWEKFPLHAILVHIFGKIITSSGVREVFEHFTAANPTNMLVHQVNKYNEQLV